LETALQALLGTQVEAQPMTGNEIILAITLKHQQTRRLDVQLVRHQPTDSILDNEKVTAVEVNQTPVTDGQHFYATIKHFLK